MIVAAGIGSVILARKLSNPLPAKMAEARAMGLPVTPEDLHINPVPDSENGAVPFHQAMKMVESGSGKADLDLINQASFAKASPSDKDAALAALQRLKPEMVLVEAATRRPHFMVPIKWADTLHQPLPEPMVAKKFVRAFCLRAQELSGRGDLQGALGQVGTAQRISRFFAEHPLVIHMLVQANCELISQITFDGIIGAHRRDVAFLREAKKLHDSFGPLPNYVETFKTALVHSLAEMSQVRTLKDAGWGTGSGIDEKLLNTELSTTDKDQIKAWLLEVNIAFFRGLPKQQDDWDRVRQLAKRKGTPNPVTLSNMSKPAAALVKGFTSLSLEPMIDLIARVQEHRRLTDTAIRLCLDRARTGRFPEKLPDYGKSSIDPFSGQPFNYEPSGNGFSLSSIGPSSGVTSQQANSLTFD